MSRTAFLAELEGVDGSKFRIAVDRPRSGRVTFEMVDGRHVEMTAVDALTIAVALLGAVEEADPPLMPQTFEKLHKLIGSVQWSAEVEKMRREDAGKESR